MAPRPQPREGYKNRHSNQTYEVLLTDVTDHDEGGEHVVYRGVDNHRKLVCDLSTFEADFRRVYVPCPACDGRGTQVWGGLGTPWVACPGCSGCRIVASPEADPSEVELHVESSTFSSDWKEELREYKLTSSDALAHLLGSPLLCQNGTYTSSDRRTTVSWWSARSPWTPGAPAHFEMVDLTGHSVTEPGAPVPGEEYVSL